MKNILLAVCGLSPQVITEALYALHQQGRQVDAVYIITTRDGRDIIYSQLLSPGDGWYYKYLRDYQLEPEQILFGPAQVKVITGEDGREINDIVDEGDNECALRACMELTFELTSDSEAAVFFLVAGGRKTMSSCLTLAAQLYGRSQDRIYHVLVSPEFESCRDFFYPPPVPVELELRNQMGEPFFKNTQYAKINLVSMPFVSIRGRIPHERLKAPQDPATLMLSLVREAKPTLTVNLSEKKIIYKKAELDLPPTLLTLYGFFALQKIECPQKENSCRTCRDCFLNIQDVFTMRDRIADLYQRIVGKEYLFFERPESRIQDIGKDAFMEYKAKIKRRLIQSFGPYVLSQLEITSISKKPDTRYGIALDKKKIRMIW